MEKIGGACLWTITRYIVNSVAKDNILFLNSMNITISCRTPAVADYNNLFSDLQCLHGKVDCIFTNLSGTMITQIIYIFHVL